MEIKMVPYAEGYLIPVDGKYLVRTESDVLKNVNVFQARCKLSTKKNKPVTSIDVNGQKVTHISEQPLK